MVARQNNRTPPPSEEHCRNDKALVITLRDAEGELIDQITAASPEAAPQQAMMMLVKRQQLCAGWIMKVEAPTPEAHSPLAPRETD
jgi:hypothetical protein